MNRAVVIGSVLVAGAAVLWAAWRFLLASTAMDSSAVIEAGNGHAYQFIAAPNISWDQARADAAKLSSQGRPGYLATIDSAAEYQLVLDRLFSKTYPDVTYLGGRQTAPGEWRWVTGPDAAADGGKGKLFWQGYEGGHAPEGVFATWMFSAFQHGGKWDVGKVCCVTLFSYRRRMFSSSLGDGDTDEGVAGYLVEFGG